MEKISTLTRQLDLIPVEVLGENITLIGAGAIGSWVTLSLAKMGFENITVYDMDTVSTENMNSQFYRFSDIGKPKVIALFDLVKDFTGVEINVKNERYTGDRVFPGTVISSVDNMAVRKQIWDVHKGVAARTRAIIDPRMGGMSALMYTARPMVKDDAIWYEKTLYSDENAMAERCTAKATIFTANLLAGMVAKTVRDLLVLGEYPKNLTWDISTDTFQCIRTDRGWTAG